MHIHQDTLTSAVALTIGMKARAHVYDWASENGMGGVELYDEIGRLATLSYDLMTRVGACPDFAEASFPGVYAYEVDEELGGWLAAAMGDGSLPAGPEAPGHLMTDHIKLELGALAYGFFHRDGRPLPHTDAIIAEMTGYEAP